MSAAHHLKPKEQRSHLYVDLSVHEPKGPARPARTHWSKAFSLVCSPTAISRSKARRVLPKPVKRRHDVIERGSVE